MTGKDCQLQSTLFYVERSWAVISILLDRQDISNSKITSLCCFHDLHDVEGTQSRTSRIKNEGWKVLQSTPNHPLLWSQCQLTRFSATYYIVVPRTEVFRNLLAALMLRNIVLVRDWLYSVFGVVEWKSWLVSAVSLPQSVVLLTKTLNMLHKLDASVLSASPCSISSTETGLYKTHFRNAFCIQRQQDIEAKLVAYETSQCFVVLCQCW